MVLIREICDAGTAVILVSHRLQEVFEVADYLTILRTILRDGSVAFQGPASSLSKAEAIEHMAGRSLEALHQTAPVARTPAPVLACRNLGRGREFADVDLDLYPGEIVGLAGLIGAGRSELAACLFGASAPETGEILFEGGSVRWSSPADAIRSGVALVPEDRKVQGLFPNLSVRWNIESAASASGRTRRNVAERLSEAFAIKSASLDAPISSLSGGNQQKAVIARWMATEPRVLILDEPTRGVDVGAKADIYRLIRSFVTDGLAVLLISSELEEVLELSHRVLVMRRGRLVAEFPENTDRRRVMSAAFGETT